MSTPNRVQIVPAAVADLPQLQALMLELLEAMTDTEGLDIESSIENCRILIEDPASHILVARDHDVIVGFVNFNTRRTMMHARLSGLIDELVVSNASQGRGIGIQLIRAAVDKCRELGCCEIEVSTEKSNMNARRFYIARGFKEDAVLLELELEA